MKTVKIDPKIPLSGDSAWLERCHDNNRIWRLVELPTDHALKPIYWIILSRL
jgi:hypothetical protein